MKRQIKITRGNQYDKDGYTITDGLLTSWGSANEDKPAGYTLDGRNIGHRCFTQPLPCKVGQPSGITV